MTPSLFEIVFEIWKTKELNFHQRGKRKYYHFDNYISFPRNIQFFKDYLSKAERNLPKHSFYPLIKSDIITPRFKVEKNSSGSKKVVWKNKIRPISYASHFDAILYSWYSTVLTEFYQDQLAKWGIEDCVLAYISKDASNIDFANEIFSQIKMREDCVALAFDISSFFDGLDHEILKSMWCKVLNIDRLPEDHFAVYKSLTQYTYVEKTIIENIFNTQTSIGTNTNGRYCDPHEFRDYIRGGMFIEKNPFYNKICDSRKFGKTCGIPQGSPISACLSNIYMIDFDQKINNFIQSVGGVYRRYCDDLIVVCDSPLASEIELIITSTIKEFELLINKEKTDIVYFKPDKTNVRSFDSKGKSKKLQYLGFEFDGNNAYIRSSSMSRYAVKMNEEIHKAVKKAYSQNHGQGNKIFRKKIYRRFAENNRRNFISYAERAAKEIMFSRTITRQYKNSVKKIEAVIKKKIARREEILLSQKKSFVSKK